ncbi:DoxX family membrane protein [Polaribacter aestuariivivens]|uniref:DoxX family membrane protein n=1 Tax=Polaribacter aestuariivivens TaxID=2304626 RepID=A0A5S3N3U2_9FLAO|nr:DoxX family membrane protein [Polaribacter aestuariivivens]TMM30018.1 DoxX family membrane protein [Polaribacter aestuariivivens]
MKTTPQQTGFALLRIAMGVNFLGHGLVRFSKLEGFKNWMITTFQDSILPNFAVSIWGSVLPFLEFAIGLLLILGLFTYRASIAGAIVIIILITGSCLVEKWDWAGMQMIYALFFYFIITNIDKNKISIDNLIQKK